MYYKIIIYKQKYVNIETARGIKARVYFQKIATKHNIHKTMLTKEQLQLYTQYKKQYDGWQLTIDTMLETEDERQSLIYKNNAKIRGLI